MRIRDAVEKCHTVKAETGHLPYIEIGDIDTITKDYFVKDKESASGAIVAKKGDILVSTVRPTRGAVTIVKESNPAVSSAFAIIRPNEKCCLQKYLFYCFCSKRFLEYLGANSKGATYPTCSKEAVFDYAFDAAELLTQFNIVKELDLLSSCIAKRQQQLNMFDNLIKARFVELFGTPFVNEKHWINGTIGDVVTEVRYGTSRPAVDGGKYPYLRMNNLTSDGYIDLNNLKRIDIPDEEVEKCIVRKGDILFNRTNSVELVGKTALFDLDEEMIIAGYIIRVRLKPILLPEIFAQYMNLKPVKDLLRSMAKGAVNQANINAQELQGIRVFIPNIELQKEFVSFKKQIDKSKFVVQQALDKAQLLFNSLMQQYFG